MDSNNIGRGPPQSCFRAMNDCVVVALGKRLAIYVKKLVTISTLSSFYDDCFPR